MNSNLKRPVPKAVCLKKEKKRRMDTVGLDPMVDIFIEECTGLLEEYRNMAAVVREQRSWDEEAINEVFRITHTLKGDATMMLCENIAVPMRALETVLYYYREEKDKADYTGFLELLESVILFIKEELECFAQVETPMERAQCLEKEIISFSSTLNKQKMPVNIVVEPRKERQRFYIASSTSNEVCAKRESTQLVKEPVKPAVASLTSKQRSTLISEEDLDYLQMLANKATHMEGRVRKQYEHDPSQLPEIAVEMRNLIDDLHAWLQTVRYVAFEHITVKLHRIIEEMNERMQRQTELLIKGDSVLIEKNRLDKISSALVHILHNCADHGIESPEEREAAGKPLHGTIMISYEVLEEGNSVRIDVSDDGRGFSKEQIYHTACHLGMIDKNAVLTDTEVLNLVFLPGFTTKKEADDYSGRGVGMDAVKHNIEEIGGTVQLFSVEGKGSQIRIELDYTVKGKINWEEKHDESLDCRR